MNQTCKVCGEPAAGFHFGAFTCEGCKVNIPFRSADGKSFLICVALRVQISAIHHSYFRPIDPNVSLLFMWSNTHSKSCGRETPLDSATRFLSSESNFRASNSHTAPPPHSKRNMHHLRSLSKAPNERRIRKISTTSLFSFADSLEQFLLHSTRNENV